jgi:AcrR family transcriptional regulator
MTIKATSGKTRMERKKAEMKRKIITVAMTLFKTQGVDATTMEQIAGEVDIAKGTLYNYFPVKEAIIDEYIKQAFRDKNADRVRPLEKLPDTHTRMTAIFCELIGGVQSQKDIFEKYVIYRMQSMVSFHQEDSEKSGFYLVATEIIRLGQKSGEIRDDLPLYILVELFEFAFIEVVKQCYLEPETFNAQEAIERCIDLCIHGAGRKATEQI